MAEANAAEVQKVIEDVQQKPNVAPIEVKAASGQVFKGTTDEVIQQMKQSVEYGSTALRQTKDELEQVRQQQLQRPIEQSPVSQDDQINAKYWEKWQKSPIEAQNFLDSVRLGVPEADVPSVLRGTLQQTQVNLQQQGGVEFQQRCPDFPGDAESSKLLVTAMQQRYGTRAPSSPQELADRLEVTYGNLVRQGKLTPAELPISTDGTGRPIPSLGSSAQSRGNMDLTEQNFRKLTPTQMKDAITRLAQQGHR